MINLHMLMKLVNKARFFFSSVCACGFYQKKVTFDLGFIILLDKILLTDDSAFYFVTRPYLFLDLSANPVGEDKE